MKNDLVERLKLTVNEQGRARPLGDYVSDWEEGEHPFGVPNPCPFCKEPQNFTEMYYNGPGSPPSYAITCGHCGAHGPTSMGMMRGDHYGAMVDAVRRWNEALTLPTPTREEVAKIINPHAFRLWQGFYEYCLRQGDDEEEARASADWAHGKDKEEALAAADAILQLIGKGG